MTIQISSVLDEAAYNRYLAARNAPRDRIVNGVRPNAIACLADYDRLAVALAGGSDDPDTGAAIPDMSAFADYHAGVVARVTPFVTMMYHAMAILRDTPALINQVAAANGEFKPFVGVDDQVDPAAYATLLQDAVEAIAAVGTILMLRGRGHAE
jgi:hypothetical protein